MLPAAAQKWKDMRKICKEQIFATHALEKGQQLRQQKLRQLVDHVQKCCDGGRAVDLRQAAFVTTFNLMSATLFSTDAAEFDSAFAAELKEFVLGVIRVIGSTNYSDLFPFLKYFDGRRLRREADFMFGRMFDLIRRKIDERVEWRNSNPNRRKHDDFLEKLMDITQSSDYDFTLNDVMHLLLDLYVAGSESTMMLIEWTMTELLRNPHKLSKAKDELKNVIGDRKMIEEAEISKLPYLQAVIKETFRVHPPGPFLFPRKTCEDVEINGYFIPKDTQILVNVWAIGRDPNVWPNPDSFEPERFLNKNIDYRGQDFELVPFGSGKRICPGLPMAHRIAHAAVAALIHNFDWKFAEGESERNRELLSGPALPREFPLKAIPLKH